MTLQLYFETPFFISTGDTPDILLIEVVEPKSLVDQENQGVKRLINSIQFLPSQM
jgi:hypothetical protein